MRISRKVAYTYDCFNSFNDCQKPVNNLKKKDFFSKLKNQCLDDDEVERIGEIRRICLC